MIVQIITNIKEELKRMISRLIFCNGFDIFFHENFQSIKLFAIYSKQNLQETVY